jgi:hypothetical protein
MAYSVRRMHHPSLRVPDLGEAERFFAEIFMRPSVSQSSIIAEKIRQGIVDPRSSRPKDYCTFTLIADVLMDSVDPSRYVIDGRQMYESVTKPQLNGLGWGVDGDLEELYFDLVEHGIRSVDQEGRPAGPDAVPIAAFSSVPLIFTTPETSGIRYQFMPASRIENWDPSDPRWDPGWVVPPPSPNDPLGIEFCAFHTIVTANAARAHTVLVDVLGGSIIWESDIGLSDTHSVFIALADAVFEIAVPGNGDSLAKRDLKGRSPSDAYHTLTWKVSDLDNAAEHLRRSGVRITARDDSTLIVNPSDALGIPWRFTDATVPNDPRWLNGEAPK